MKTPVWLICTGLLCLLAGCQKDEPITQNDPALVFTMAFDAQQARLDNLGNPSVVATGNAAQTPDMANMAVHYIELAPTATTQLGEGMVVYNSPSTTQGGATAIDMGKLNYVGNGQTYARVALQNIPPGTYEYVRVSLA